MKNLPNTGKGEFDFRSGADKLMSVILPSLVLTILLLAWEVVVKKAEIEQWILPGPSLILESFWQARELIWKHSMQTVLEAASGFVIAIIIAVCTATLVDLSVWARKAIYPLLVISQTIPIIAVAPLFIIWFGYGMATKVVVVALVCFFPITVNLADGYRMVDRDMIKLMQSMGAGKLQVFRLVKLPAALPFFFSGLRIAGTYSVMGAVIGEWLGADKGLGVLMTRSSQSFLTDRVFATIMVIVVLSLLMCFMIEGIARLMIPWHFRRGEQI